MPLDTLDRYRGCLLGLAVGDCIGVGVEFMAPGTFSPVRDMMGSRLFGLKPGEWTDDTSMALCLAESLIECKGFDPKDQLCRYLRWYERGHLSSIGRCFDIGNTVREALRRYKRTGEAYCGSKDPHSAGNGSLMRLAPVPMFYARCAREAVRRSGESSETTHRATEAVDACRFFAALLCAALSGMTKQQLCQDGSSPVPGLCSLPLCQSIAEIRDGSYKRKNPPDIKGTGYVVRSLEAALWAFYRGETFEEGVLLAANLGDDADTTAAIYGQIAGAYYGESGIPERWLKQIVHLDLIRRFADEIHTLAAMEGNAQAM